MLGKGSSTAGIIGAVRDTSMSAIEADFFVVDADTDTVQPSQAATVTPSVTTTPTATLSPTPISDAGERHDVVAPHSDCAAIDATSPAATTAVAPSSATPAVNSPSLSSSHSDLTSSDAGWSLTGFLGGLLGSAACLFPEISDEESDYETDSDDDRDNTRVLSQSSVRRRQ